MNKILLLFITFLAFDNGQAIAQNIGKNKTDQEDGNYNVEQWNVVEITLTSSKIYTDPFNQVEVTATFSGPDGKIIIRPAFWDGDTTWKIRFAPTKTGEWKMVTSCNDVTNPGLHTISRSIKCKPYSGSFDIYKHGFLKVSDDTTWSEFAEKNQSLLTTNGQEIYVVYFSNRVPSTGTLKNMEKNVSYTAKWFNTRNGNYTIIKTFKTGDGTWTIPDKPDSEDWILLVERNQF